MLSQPTGRGRTAPWYKVTKSHILCKRNKMKVKFATQTLSDALLHCAKDLNLPQFREAEATAEFFYVFNLLFDIDNSKNSFCKHSKAPLSNGNKIYWDH